MSDMRSNLPGSGSPKASRRGLLVGLGATIVAGGVALTPASAAPVLPAAPPLSGSSVLDIKIPLGGGPQVLVPVTLDQRVFREDALAALRTLRRDMWATNPWFNGKRLQEFLKAQGITTAPAYAAKVQWSMSIEIYAIQRALECLALGGLRHSRPDGGSIWAFQPEGASLSGESLAAGYRSITELLASGGWGYGELEALNASRGRSNSENGHLHQMLNPSNITFGMGQVGVYYAALSSRKASESTRGSGYSGDYSLRTAIPAAALDRYTYSGTTSLAVGATGTATVSDRSGSVLQGTWSSSDTRVATVDDSGRITGRRAGTASIRLAVDGRIFAGTVTVNPAQRFTDVPPGMMFFEDIEWLAAQGIATGWPDRTYRPLLPIARDAMAAFLYRAMGSPALTPPRVPTFRDVGRGTMYYKEIEWLAEQGITTGWPDGTFRPLARSPVTPWRHSCTAPRGRLRSGFRPPRPSVTWGVGPCTIGRSSGCGRRGSAPGGPTGCTGISNRSSVMPWRLSSTAYTH